jgi:hypothetical protein
MPVKLFFDGVSKFNKKDSVKDTVTKKYENIIVYGDS